MTAAASRHGIKQLANGIALVMVMPAAAMCWLETKWTDRGESVFAFWAQLFAMLPGRPGMYLRRGFYRLTLESCDPRCYIGFGAICSHRDVRIERDVYVGTYSLIGSAWLHQRCLIGSRGSLLSGGALHELGPDQRWTPTDLRRLRQIHVGPDTWIGEAAVVFADIGAGALVAAGAVVSTDVAPGIVVAGNPARFVRTLSAPKPSPDAQEQETRYGTAVV